MAKVQLGVTLAANEIVAFLNSLPARYRKTSHSANIAGKQL